KRNFGITPEPSGGGASSLKALGFVIQKHWASRLHYDFRLEFEGTLKSWAVPKGPSLDPHDKRMAVQVEDHPISYGSFEGTIPPKQYGAGQVIVWDKGSWLPLEDPAKGFREGKLKFELVGHKLKGRWTLVRMRGNNEKQPPWLLIKEHDEHERPASEYDITTAEPDSVSRLDASPSAPKPAKTSTLAVSTRTKLPPMLEPQLATLVESAPSHGDWIYELKFDGYRLMTRLDGGQAHCFTRNGHDWTAKMPQLASSLKALGLEGTWLDGEIVVPDKNGIPNFQLLQGAFEARGRHLAASVASTSAAAPIVYYLFDMPFHDGHDLRDAPLAERRKLLQKLLADKSQASSNIRFSDAFDAASKDLMLSACKLGFEGLIGKRSDSPYQSRRSADWIKLKCGKRQEFVICGYTEPKGSRAGLGALLLGVHDDKGSLQYAGNVGSGFDDATLLQLTKTLEKISTGKKPFDDKTAIVGKPHWVQPNLLAEVSFADWTSTGRIRHAVFRGLRSDKKPQAITREKAVKPPAALKSAAPARPAASPNALPKSLRVTHADRVIDDSSGLTKLDIVQHYAAVADLMLPHLKGRPVSLVRAPSGVAGELFFQKHIKAEELPGVRLLDPAFDPEHDS
ncbi:MAG: DNA ligase D, partial [Pseudomonadota bacterium]